MEGKHAILIPSTVLTQVQDLLQQANTLLLLIVTPLTPSERHALAKMGEKTLSFVEKSHEFAAQNPNLVPPFLDMAAFDINFADAHNLWPLFLLTQQLHESVDDTTKVAGSEAYQFALVFYNSVKMAARQDIPGAKVIYEELKKRFPGHRHRSNSDGETETETND
jgi:hypothetical protein